MSDYPTFLDFVCLWLVSREEYKVKGPDETRPLQFAGWSTAGNALVCLQSLVFIFTGEGLKFRCFFLCFFITNHCILQADLKIGLFCHLHSLYEQSVTFGYILSFNSIFQCILLGFYLYKQHIGC